MPRIIAGVAGSIPLKSRSGSHTRPTADRVKEALFARLDAIGMIEGSAVLDLCAGSGALALEAVSRGAVSADLVEKNVASYRFLQENIATIFGALRKPGENREGLPRIEGHRSSASRFLESAAPGKSWDVVFLIRRTPWATEKSPRMWGCLARALRRMD